jgi:hypothetical protein
MARLDTKYLIDYSLDTLRDVNPVGFLNGGVLVYNETEGKWELQLGGIQTLYVLSKELIVENNKSVIYADCIDASNFGIEVQGTGILEVT